MTTDSLSTFSPEAAHAVRTLAEAIRAHGGQSYLVGGSVRDTILGRAPKDIDIETYGIPLSQLQTLLEELFPGEVKLVGKSFGILKVHRNGYDIDVALPRTESKTGQGYHGFVFSPDPNLSMDEASRRRDFTINAMLMDPLSGKLFDPHHGRKDLEQRILRAVQPDSFVEDPLRVYRALQFVARFHLTVEPNTLALMKQMVADGELEHLSQERIRQELQKLFTPGVDPSRGISLAQTLGINIDHI